MPSDQDKWDRYRSKPGTDKWDRYKAKAPAPWVQPTPESTLAKVGRGTALGAFEGLGVKPATTPGEVVTGSIKQFGTGLMDLLSDTYKANALPITAGMPAVGQAGQAALTVLDIIPTLIGKTATTLARGLGLPDKKNETLKDGNGVIQAIQNKDWEQASESAASTMAQIAALRSPRRALEGGEFETVGTIRKGVRNQLQKALGPTDVSIAGEKVPVLKGEAQPETWGGRLQAGTKRGGVGQGRFDQVSNYQIGKVKEIIRKTAQGTSEAIGPMPEDPGAAIGRAAGVTFSKASPMYKALDEALVTVPDSLSNVSKVVEQAIARARKLGVEVNTEGSSVTIGGHEFSPQSDPVAWQRFREQGIVGTGRQPLSTYMKVRSELLDMKRMSKDASQAYVIGNELKSMNANIENALKGSPLLDSWNEANRLWSKGYALRELADVFRERTHGTPSPLQPGGLSKVPTTVSGRSLVDALNELEHDGTLSKGLSHQEATNIRQAADILDRASEQAGSEFRIGHSSRGTFLHYVQHLPAIPLVRAMTKVDGVAALKAGWLARSPSQAMQAAMRLSRIAGVGGVVYGQNGPPPNVQTLQKAMKESLAAP